MANLDRNRAEKLMLEIGVEALILLSPESFIYANGFKVLKCILSFEKSLT